MQPVDLRHRHVHDDDVWIEASFELYGFGAAPGLADHLDIGLVFEDVTKALTHQRVIVSEQDANRVGRS